MKLGVIVPTIGRETLEHTLSSLAPQLQDDYAVVACDAAAAADAAWVSAVARSYHFHVFLVGSQTKAGHHATNRVLNTLPSSVTHTWRLDDDDVAMPDALEVLRGAACHRPVFARFQYHASEAFIWERPGLVEGNVGSPCILAPRSEARWGDRYEGDFDYAERLVEELGDPFWLDRVVAEVHLSR